VLTLLHADLLAQNVQVAVISETWFKARHTTAATTIPGYNVYRLDRVRRRGGGVAIYVDVGVRVEVCSTLGNKDYEVLWIKTYIGTSPLFICALYHPPAPVYEPTGLLDYLEVTVADIIKTTPGSPTVIIAGDMNRLPADRLVSLGLLSLVNIPTHRGNCLDRMYCNVPSYINIKVVSSLIRTAHAMVVACPDARFIKDINKQRRVTYMRNRTPAQDYTAVKQLANINWSTVLTVHNDAQLGFNYFYAIITSIVDSVYPLRRVTITSRDPPFITPSIKLLLRRRNRLMRVGNVEEAGAISVRVGVAITAYNSRRLADLNLTGGGSAGGAISTMWERVRKISGGGVFFVPRPTGGY